jgi:hypothetical protein
LAGRHGSVIFGLVLNACEVFSKGGSHDEAEDNRPACGVFPSRANAAVALPAGRATTARVDQVKAPVSGPVEMMRARLCWPRNCLTARQAWQLSPAG